MVRENRVVAKLLIEGADLNKWKAAIYTNNALQKRSPASAKRNATAIRKRLESLNTGFWNAIVEGDDELARQVVLCSVLERNLLLVEFMESVLLDAYQTKNEKLEVYQWMDFLDDCSNRDPSIGLLKESTRKKMQQVAFRILAEGGYLYSSRKPKLQRVKLRSELIVLLDRYKKNRIKRCMEVSS